jgi:hypothetical protein
MTTAPMTDFATSRTPNATPIWPDEPNPHWRDYERDDKARHKAERAALRRAHLVKIDRLKGKVLDRLDALLDRIAPQPASDLPLVLARRQIAHLVGAPLLCSRKLCRRTRACRGEPRQCLAAIVPLLPPDKVAALTLGARSTRRGRACPPRLTLKQVSSAV